MLPLPMEVLEEAMQVMDVCGSRWCGDQGSDEARQLMDRARMLSRWKVGGKAASEKNDT